MPPNPNQQHVFYRGTDDHIHHLLWDPVSGRVFADDWTLPSRVPLSAGNPAAMATERQQHVFYRSGDGHIHHVLWSADKRRLYRDVWTAAPGAKLAEGDPVTMVTPGQQHVFYRGPGGALCHIFWDGSARRLFFDDWTAKAGPGAGPAAGDPSTLVTAGQQHVFYRGRAGGVHHIFWDASSGNLRHDDWSAGVRGAPLAAGNVATMETGGQQHVFYRGTDNSISHILWAPMSGALHHDDWMARAGAPAAAGDPATMVTAEGQQHVFYRGVGGAINHIFWDPSSPSSLTVDDWTARARPPSVPADGAPATMLFRGQQHVFYRGPGGAIDHILWDPSSPHALGFDDWTSRGFAPKAVGDPATLVTSDEPTDYVWTILPLGDSLTEGFQGDKGGFRVPLFETAMRRGKRIRFAGTLKDAPPDPVIAGVPFPQQHEGHSGNHIDQIAALVPDVLASGPDIILLMIGTNDILDSSPAYRSIVAQAPDRLAGLIDKIIDSQVGSLIVVAQIPPIPSVSALVDRYNEGVGAVVRKRAEAGERVLLADMHTSFPLSFLSGWDNIHPNQKGYDHIAAVWYAAIEAFLT